jgi:hypothetical protein
VKSCLSIALFAAGIALIVLGLCVWAMYGLTYHGPVN